MPDIRERIPAPGLNPGEQLDLLDYPRTPGWQDRETSIEAAEEIAPEVPRLRDKILTEICGAYLSGGLTADETAIRLRLTRSPSARACASSTSSASSPTPGCAGSTNPAAARSCGARANTCRRKKRAMPASKGKVTG
jgi:hypothetical protein